MIGRRDDEGETRSRCARRVEAEKGKARRPDVKVK
jgi:hypothetical protein